MIADMRTLRAAAGLGLLIIVLVAGVPANAAEPAPTAGPVGGDPRSSGQGPGLVGDPLFAIGAVVVIGLASVLLTIAYVRLTENLRGGRRS